MAVCGTRACNNHYSQPFVDSHLIIIRIFVSSGMRIAGVTIPEKKPLMVGLTELYGVGRTHAAEVLAHVGVSLSARPADLSTEEENKIRQEVERFTIEGDLRRETSSNIKRLKDIGSYRGTRHIKGLPSRGQQTKTNSRTVRGNVRKTMGSGKRKVEKK